MASQPSPSADVAGPAIRVTDLVYAWGGQQPVIDIPSFTVERGERIFLRGPSGSGKSTLLGLIGGVLEPSSGRLETLGQDLATMPRRQRDRFRAAHIGFIFQMFNLLPYLSVVDNVLLPLRFSERRRGTLTRGGMQPAAEARRLLDALGIPADALDRPATALSQGQQQRVAAARALIGRPDLLIADEPTSSLDADAREAFLALLMRECGAAGTTVVFVSHDASLAPLFDRSVALTDINRALP